MTTKKSGKKYLNNKSLLEQVLISKEQGQMSDELANMLQLLCTRFAKKPNYANYTYIEDMQAYAMFMLVKNWFKFDETKSTNPFAFYTQCIYHSFIQYLNSERKQRDIRDLSLIELGMNPSYTFQMAHGESLSDIDDSTPYFEDDNTQSTFYDD